MAIRKSAKAPVKSVKSRPYVPVAAVPGNAQTEATKAWTKMAVAYVAKVDEFARKAPGNKVKAKVEGQNVFVPTVKLKVAGNVEDMRGRSSPKPIPAYHPPLVQPKPTPAYHPPLVQPKSVKSKAKARAR